MGERSELGHWEGDQIIGANNASSMLWLTEQVTRYSIGVTMPEGYSAGAMVGRLVDGLERIRDHHVAPGAAPPAGVDGHPPCSPHEKPVGSAARCVYYTHDSAEHLHA